MAQATAKANNHIAIEPHRMGAVPEPIEFAICLFDWEVVNAGEPPLHQNLQRHIPSSRCRTSGTSFRCHHAIHGHSGRRSDFR
jgi:hypothetical protein